MTIRDEYEFLKTDLKIKLVDATDVCSLDDLPFDIIIPHDEEIRYFLKGLKVRLTTKRAMIILDNTYKKVRLFPSDEIADSFIETRDEILKDYRRSVLNAFAEEPYRFKEDDEESYAEYIDQFIEKIKKATEPYIAQLRKLTQKDIEREINEKDKIKQMEEHITGKDLL